MSAIVKMAVVWDVAPCRLLMMGAAGVVWKVGELLPDYTEHRPRRQPISE
jgi:hypothetical protein